MASPNIYTRAKGREFTNTENPLDRAVGDFEQDEAVRPTTRPWGWYPFLYQSPTSIDLGDGLLEFPGPGNYPLPSIDLWQFPNAEQFAGLQFPTPEAEEAAGEDIVKNLCTDDTVQNATIRTICLPIAKADGCLELKTILPSFTSTLSVDVFNIQFPNGFTMDITDSVLCINPNTGTPGGRIIRATIFHTGQPGVTTVCEQTYHTDTPSVNCNPPSTFEQAMTLVLSCVKAVFGNDYQGLGC